MTSHLGRLYALAFALVVFFLTWAVVAAHPWASPAPDKRLRALAVREAELRREAKLVHEVVAQRWAAYTTELKLRRARIAAVRSRAAQLAAQATVASAPASAAPSVQVVTLPPLTITRSS